MEIIYYHLGITSRVSYECRLNEEDALKIIVEAEKQGLETQRHVARERRGGQLVIVAICGPRAGKVEAVVMIGDGPAQYTSVARRSHP